MILKNGKLLIVCEAQKSDAADIIKYLNIVGGESDNLLFGKGEFYATVEEEEAFIEAITRSATSAMILGRIDGELVSVGTLTSNPRNRIAHQSEFAISVLKKHQNIGVGSAVTAKLIEYSKSNGITEVIHLKVRSDNFGAMHLYKKHGFKEIGLYEKFMKIVDAYYDIVMMNLYL